MAGQVLVEVPEVQIRGVLFSISRVFVERRGEFWGHAWVHQMFPQKLRPNTWRSPTATWNLEIQVGFGFGLVR